MKPKMIMRTSISNFIKGDTLSCSVDYLSPKPKQTWKTVFCCFDLKSLRHAEMVMKWFEFAWMDCRLKPAKEPNTDWRELDSLEGRRHFEALAPNHFKLSLDEQLTGDWRVCFARVTKKKIRWFAEIVHLQDMQSAKRIAQQFLNAIPGSLVKGE